jgi:hypothetical protein
MGRTAPLWIDQVQPLIHLIRGRRVILDSDLAALYGVPTHRFNETVKRNSRRFPEDFRFQLTRPEVVALNSMPGSIKSETIGKEYDSAMSSQIAMTSKPRRAAAYLPWVFTEHGALMAANILRSSRAIEMSVHVIRAFIHLRDTLAVHRELSARLTELEAKSVGYDTSIAELCEAMRLLLASPEPPHDRKIGCNRQ